MELGTVQVLPETNSEQRMHVLDETCWCNPTLVTDDGTELRHH